MQERLNLLEIIERDLLSDDPLAHAYAIRACCIKGISSPVVIDELKKLKHTNEISMLQNIANSATAALDILGVEKYTGSNSNIIEIIETCYYSK